MLYIVLSIMVIAVVMFCMATVLAGAVEKSACFSAGRNLPGHYRVWCRSWRASYTSRVIVRAKRKVKEVVVRVSSPKKPDLALQARRAAKTKRKAEAYQRFLTSVAEDKAAAERRAEYTANNSNRLRAMRRWAATTKSSVHWKRKKGCGVVRRTPLKVLYARYPKVEQPVVSFVHERRERLRALKEKRDEAIWMVLSTPEGWERDMYQTAAQIAAEDIRSELRRAA